VSFQLVDRPGIYYFSPDDNIYSMYSSTNSLDLSEIRNDFVSKLKELPYSQREAIKIQEIYKEALLSQGKVIKASTISQNELSDTDLINLHLILADTISQDIEVLSDKKPSFKRVASSNHKELYAYRKIYLKIK
jgi:hypothetical protein